MKKPFRERIKEKKPLILDGAMGTVLFGKGLETGRPPELLCMTEPELIAGVHREYVAAGAELVYTDTFGANAEKLGDKASSVELVKKAVELAKTAVGDEVYVALDMGPVGRLFEPGGTLTFDETYALYKEMAVAGEQSGAELAVLETFSSLGELRAAILAIKENTSLPIMATMTFESTGRTFTGVLPSAFALTASGLGADAIGVNCSLGPKELVPVVEELARFTSLPIVAKPNAGLPDTKGNYVLSAREFAEQCRLLIEAGASIIGGCCGTSPEFIRELKAVAEATTCVHRPERIKTTALCSPTQTVIADRPLIVGERLNPTGKRALKEAYSSGDVGYVLRQAVEQADAGAALLDVNTGVPGIDEARLMKSTVSAVSSVCTLPLSVDSPSPEALEAGLRAFQGKALVNSVNGERASLERVLPLVKKYGAAVIGLCLDENGVPDSAEKRFEIAKRIVSEAERQGIPHEDIIIDCLTLTVSAEQSQAMETLEAIRRVKHELNVKTVLGVSNISFGLPERELISSAFLVMALSSGLDLAIINPNSAAMAYAFRAYAVLSCADKGAEEYISACTDEAKRELFKAGPVNKAATALHGESVQSSDKDGFTKMIIKGLSVREETVRLLKEKAPLDVVNEYLIPALDEAGRLFEAGKLFLPQLITAAETAKQGFEEVKKLIPSGEADAGTIVLATVKGDVHDIGKNIVKVVLENYGYRVIDLGKNVEIETVAEAVVKNGVRLLGLSALMTTTVVNMQRTIELVKKEAPDCRIMVGGAVLTAEYAAEIGADYYAKDANASVAIARRIFSAEPKKS